MPHTISVEPTAEPVTVAEAKAWLNESGSDNDADIAFMIQTAREYVETYSGRALMPQTWSLFLDAFPLEIRPGFPPLTSVTSITYTDTAGNTGQTVDASIYDFDVNTEPGRIREAFGQSWPSTRREMNAVTVLFVAGYADAASVPESLKTAIKLLVAEWFCDREAVITGLSVKDLPFGVQALITQYQVPQI